MISGLSQPDIGQQENNPGRHMDSDVSFGDFTGLEVSDMLRNNQVFSGLLMSDNSGPTRSNHQVAMCRGEGYYSAAWIRKENDLDVEIIKTQSERESRYAHHGWSPSAMSNLSPWTISRTAGTNQSTRAGTWRTDRMTIQTVLVKIPLEELKPNPSFESEVRAALGLQKKSEKVQAVYEVLKRWGDMIPLLYDLGASLSITDLEPNIQGFSFWDSDFSLPKSANLSIKGGTIRSIRQGIDAWSEQNLKPRDCRIVRIVEAVPTFRLLDIQLQKELMDLHSTILSMDQTNQDEPTKGSKTWNDADFAFRTLSSVAIRSGCRIDGLSLAYRDGSRTSHRGDHGGHEHSFDLAVDEHIIDVLVWKKRGILFGVQFITTKGRMSPHYGDHDGIPTLLSCSDGVLAGLSGSHDGGKIGPIQAIWRHDIMPNVPIKYAEYIGGTGGKPFNDWAYVGNSHFTHVSRIDINCGADIDGIQFTYTKKQGADASITTANFHGARGGAKRNFQLDADDHIVSVCGTHNGRFLRGLCFGTYKGRTSSFFGENHGSQFKCQPRTKDGKAMRLYFVAGKCGDRVDGLLFVWIPIE
ncbi:Jacalin-like lectin domain protein [Ceratobasidium sp. AG-Ba]|nr:Jacalin-like lectin domain protein [Ceratobasidium sp. AG-Ba]